MADSADSVLVWVRTQADAALGARPPLEAVVEAVRACHAAAEDAVTAQLEQMARMGERPACRSGCAFCCHQHIAVSPAELVAIADSLARWPEERLAALRDRLGRDGPRIAALDHAGREAARIACALLDRKTGMCGAYDRRPIACRSHFSTLRTACERHHRNRGQRRPGDRGLPVPNGPKTIASAALVGLDLVLDERGLSVEPVELSVALELVRKDPTSVDRWLDGGTPFPPLAPHPDTTRARLGRRYAEMLQPVRARLDAGGAPSA